MRLFIGLEKIQWSLTRDELVWPCWISLVYSTCMRQGEVRGATQAYGAQSTVFTPRRCFTRKATVSLEWTYYTGLLGSLRRFVSFDRFVRVNPYNQTPRKEGCSQESPQLRGYVGISLSMTRGIGNSRALGYSRKQQKKTKFLHITAMTYILVHL